MSIADESQYRLIAPHIQYILRAFLRYKDVYRRELERFRSLTFFLTFCIILSVLGRDGYHTGKS